MRLGRRSRNRAASTSRGPRTPKLECPACPEPIRENPQPSGSRPLGRSCGAPHADTIELQGLSTGDDNVGRNALHRLTEASSEAEEMQSMPRRCQEASRRPNNSLKLTWRAASPFWLAWPAGLAENPAGSARFRRAA